MECKYKYDLPGAGKCCHKHYETEREDGKIWTHFSLCEDENCPIIYPKLLSAAKKKADKVCLWCGAPLENKGDSFCSVYCVSMWGGEGD